MFNPQFTVLNYSEVTMLERFRFEGSWWRKVTRWDAEKLNDDFTKAISHHGQYTYLEFEPNAKVGCALDQVI